LAGAQEEIETQELLPGQEWKFIRPIAAAISPEHDFLNSLPAEYNVRASCWAGHTAADPLELLVSVNH
jgi:hypothetical protein